VRKAELSVEKWLCDINHYFYGLNTKEGQQKLIYDMFWVVRISKLR